MPEEEEGVTPPEPDTLPEEPDPTVPEPGPERTYSTRLRLSGWLRRRELVEEEARRRLLRSTALPRSRIKLFKPLPKLGALGLLSVFDDLFGRSVGGFAGALCCRCPDRTQFGRRQRCVLEPSVRYAEFGWRRLASLQVFDGDAELAGDSSQRLHRWRSRAGFDPRDVRIADAWRGKVALRHAALKP